MANYGYARRPGFAPFAPAQPRTAAMAPYRAYPMMGVDPNAAAQPSLMDNVNDFLNTQTGPLQNKWWLALGLAGGALWYASAEGWLG